MAATAAAGPRYAPEDPTLPKPWRGLVDGKTGYLYFWNPETNVTQYERPMGSAPLLKSSSVPISSSVHVQQSARGQHHYHTPDERDDEYGKGGSGGSKLDVGTRSQQSARSGTVASHNAARGGVVSSLSAPNGTVFDGHGGSLARGHGTSDAGSVFSAESYRRRHEISVTGDNVPPPFTSFEATGFPSEILREVRYLLLGGANVVRCAALFGGLAFILECPYTVDQFFWKGFPNHPSLWRGLLLVMIQSATQSE